MTRTFAFHVSSRAHKRYVAFACLHGWIALASHSVNAYRAGRETSVRHHKRLKAWSLGGLRNNVTRTLALLDEHKICHVRTAFAFWGEALGAKKRAMRADYKAAGARMRNLRVTFYTWQEMSAGTMRLLDGMRRLEIKRLWNIAQHSFHAWKLGTGASSLDRWGGGCLTVLCFTSFSILHYAEISPAS
jgi:hypothetical protein